MTNPELSFHLIANESARSVGDNHISETAEATVVKFLHARRYASAGIALVRLSVCLSVCVCVCHRPVLYQNG